MHDGAPPAPSLIDHQTTLDALAGQFTSLPFLALDTEFVRECTYYAQLCLLQVAADGTPACIDPLAGLDLAPLWNVVVDAAPMQLMHGAGQDLELIHQHTGRLPGALFDTQVAAGLLGWQPQIGYGALVESLLGVRLGKRHTRTDWSRRPLSVEQLSYAADDVRYLPAVHAELHARLEARGRLVWMQEDCAALLEPAAYLNPPEEAWRRIKGLGRLEKTGRQIAAALAAWRERTAERLNRPRQWIMTDAALLAVASAQPCDMTALRRAGPLPPGLLRRRGQDLLDVVRGGSGSAPAPPPAAPPLDEQERACLAVLRQATRECAAELQLDPQVLATRAELTALARGGGDLDGLRVFRGWRGEVLGQRLRALV